MKIVDERKKKIITFKELGCGSVFGYGEDVFMRISGVSLEVNAVDLLNGKAVFFHGSKLVSPLNVELVIHDHGEG